MVMGVGVLFCQMLALIRPATIQEADLLPGHRPFYQIVVANLIPLSNGSHPGRGETHLGLPTVKLLF